MTKPSQDHFIGFPDCFFLGKQGVRLRVLSYEPGVYMALDKPQGFLIDVHPWYPENFSLVSSLYTQREGHKKELEPYKMECAKGIYFLDPEISGVGLIAVSDSAVQDLRNAYGSSGFTFRFLLLTQFNEQLTDEEKYICSKPLAPDRDEHKMIPSHPFGKKCETTFRKLQDYGFYSLWQAESCYLRPHQVRAHAALLGLNVVGEDKYTKTRSITLSDLISKKKNIKALQQMPFYEGICIHLESIQIGGNELIVDSLPKKFEILIKKLENIC